MTTDRLGGDLVVTGNVTVGGSLLPALARSALQQEDLAVYPIPFENWRVWNDLNLILPATSAADDLGIYVGSSGFGTDAPLVRTYDVKGAGAVTLYARTLVSLPAEYVTAQTVVLRFGAGMVTTVSDGTATLDVEAYRLGKDNTIGSDICATAATSINSITFANYSYTITATTLAGGDVLDVRITVAVNDGATGTAVIAAIAGADLLCDIKG